MRRPRRYDLVFAPLCFLVLGGCIGTPAATRTLVIHQPQSRDDVQEGFVVDTSRLPPGVITQSDERVGRTGPVTELYLDISSPVKIMIVPADRR